MVSGHSCWNRCFFRAKFGVILPHLDERTMWLLLAAALLDAGGAGLRPGDSALALGPTP